MTMHGEPMTTGKNRLRNGCRGMAWMLYEASCDAGGALSCNNLGRVRELGIIGPQDLHQARALYEKACREGEDMGCPGRVRDAPRAAAAPGGLARVARVGVRR
jgi:TPR repeat protein